MATVRTLIGNVKGPKGDTGATGAQGEQGKAASIAVGTVSTAAYGSVARVTNSGTDSDAVLDFVIPQGMPGENITDASGLSVNTVTSSAAEFPVPNVGETIAVIIGKIVKFFNDVKQNGLFKSDLQTSGTVDTAGQYALDAVEKNPSVSGSLGAQIASLSNSVDAKAPKSHAATTTTYGAGNASNYGHVKLSDNYTSSAGAASASVGASSKAVYDAYNTLKSLVVMSEVTSSEVTVNANSRSESTTISASKTGYKILGVVGWRIDGTGGADLVPAIIRRANDTSINFYLRNCGTANRTVTLVCQVLYMKSL